MLQYNSLIKINRMSNDSPLSKFGLLLKKHGITQTQIVTVSEIIYPDQKLTKNQISMLASGKNPNFQMQTLERVMVIIMILIGKKITPNDVIDYEYLVADVFSKDGLINIKKTEIWKSKNILR